MEVPGTKWISINVDLFNSHFSKSSAKKEQLALGVKPRWRLESVCLCVCTHLCIVGLSLTSQC